MEQTIQADIKVSIIIPAYNAALYLERTLRSVFEQSLPDFEIVLIDDGSTDSTGQIVEKLQQKDPRLNYFYKDNGGVSSARNLGIEKARGEFISFLDSDDTYEPDFLEKMYNQITEVRGDLCYCGFSYEIYGKKVQQVPVNFEIPDPLNFMLEGKAMASMNSWFIRRSFINDIQIYFSTDISYGEDIEFCCKLLYEAKSGICTCIKEYLTNYNLHHGSLSERQNLWYLPPRMLGDIKSSKGIFDYMKMVNIPRTEHYLSAAASRIKEKYLYYLWGSLLLGRKEDFKLLYRFYEQDQNEYSLTTVSPPGVKIKIWKFCVSTYIGRFIGRYILRYYKYIQRSYR